MSEFQKYRRGLEPGTIERHDFGSKAGDPDWCYSCGEHRNHPAHAAKDAELTAVKVSNNKWLAKWERAEAALAEARKALKLAEQMMTKDSLCEAERLEEGLSVVRRALTGGQADG